MLYLQRNVRIENIFIFFNFEFVKFKNSCIFAFAFSRGNSRKVKSNIDDILKI
jgi:hypothetical protein